MKMSKHRSCLIHRNLLTGISYSDATPGQSFAYDHLGNLTQITDAAGTRTLACNPTENWKADALRQRHCLQASPSGYDELGRLDGFKLSADDRRVQKTHLSYDGEGHLSILTAECMEKPSFGSTLKERKRTGSSSRSKT